MCCSSRGKNSSLSYQFLKLVQINFIFPTIYIHIYCICILPEFDDTTLCDKVCQCLVAGQWSSSGTPVSSTNKTDRHDITEIFLKVALNFITLTLNLKRQSWNWINMSNLNFDHYLLCVFKFLKEISTVKLFVLKSKGQKI